MRMTVAGAETFVADGGQPIRPGAPSVLLLHGAGMDHTAWAGQTRALAHRGVGVVAPDWPGHGASAGSALPGIDAMAGWAAMLLDELELDRVLIAGHSMGALAALALAAHYPARAAGLILFGAGATMPVHPDLIATAKTDPQAAATMIAGWAHGRRARKGGNPMPGLWMPGAAIRLIASAGPGVLAGDLIACDAWDRSAEAAQQIPCPVDIVIGAEDRMTPPKTGRALAGLFPQARLTDIAGAGHMMMTEAPEETRQALYRAVAHAFPPEHAA